MAGGARRGRAALPALLYTCSLFVFCAPAYAGGTLPTGGQFAAGQGTIAGNGNNLTINQSSSHGIVNWQSFSIGSPNSVQFNNGAGATLNRVTGGNLSRIDGSLSATGSVYLINPQGVVVGPGGTIVTNGSFVASTRDIPNGQFMAGGAMTASGTSNGDVVNAGTITSKTGDAILVGRSVVNSGTINAPEGQADLAAGNEIILQPVNGDSHIAISGGKGDVTNTGTVKAAQAALDSAGGNVYALVQNNGGLVSATGTTIVDGHVWLTAGGSTTVSGTVSAQNADGSGGKVTVRSQEVSLSGSIDASATQVQKSGGDVSVIAEDRTVFTGTIKARGGAGGQGGTVETSGGRLEVGGSTVDAGEGGLWLLDPYDLIVDSSAATSISGTLGSGSDVALQTGATSTVGPGTSQSGSGDITINSAISWGTSATLTMDAYHGIYVNAPIAVSGGGGVMLNINQGGSGGVYDFGLSGSGFASGIDFTGGSGSGASLAINGTGYTLLYDMSDVAAINGTSGHYALATTIDASSAGTYTGSVAASFSGTLEGLGNGIANLTINDTAGNNNVGLIGNASGTLSNLTITGSDVTGGDGAYVGILAGRSTATISNVLTAGQVASGNSSSGNTISVGGLAGYVNGGSISDSMSSATVTGGDASSTKAAYAGGLAGRLLGATITGSHADGDVVGGAGNDNQVSYAGGLVGQANGSSTITDSYATGSISGGFHAYVGGLAGDDGGTVTDSYATGAVSDNATEQESRVLTGGLVGYAHGTISGSHATGAVTSPDTSRAGGLVGYSAADISNSYASGAVSGGDAAMVGGLVGFASGGTITGSHASGAAQTGDAIVTYGPTVVTNSYAGGFIGYVNTAATTITLSYATGAASGGETSYVGGFAGLNNGSISQSYATGSATTGDGPLTFLAIAGGLVGYNSSNGSIAETYSTGAVRSTCFGGTACASVILGGLVGKNTSTASAIKQSYFDSETSGQTTVGADFKLDNVVELTTAELQSGLPSGFNGGGNSRPTDSWATVAGVTFPYLAAQFSGTPQVISGTAYTDGGASIATSGTVSLLADGTDLGAASIGINGYYYALEPQDTVQTSTALLASTTDVAGSRLETGATALDSNSDVLGFDVWGGTLIAPTSETTYSAATTLSLQAQDAGLISQALGGNTDPTTGLTNYGFIASGDFTIDQSLTLSNGLFVRTTAGDITVAYGLALSGTNALVLDSSGALAIDAPITLSDGTQITLNYDDSDATNLSFGLTASGFTGSIDYGSTDNGGTLSINGTGYTLLYTMAELQAINTDDTSLQGNYALASSLDGSTTSGFVPIGTDGAGTLKNGGAGFSGGLTGLGHTISGLVIDIGTYNNAALFGETYGTIRDLGLEGGSVTGGQGAGAIAGANDGLITDAYANTTVHGSLDYVGGLVASNGGTISRSYALGAVSSDSEVAGGLAGVNLGTLKDVYATGTVTARVIAGGLVGESLSGTITNAYAAGAVSANGFAAGLIGLSEDTIIDSVYATGAIGGSGGGLMGSTLGDTVTNAYWDTDTSGKSSSAGGIGLTTAQLQDGSSASGLGSAFTVTSGLYPYLTSFFPNGVQAISGTAYEADGTTALASGASGAVTVSLDAYGGLLGQTSTGANGYYYIALPAGAVSVGSNLVASLPTDAATGAVNAATLAASTYAGVDTIQSGIDLYSGFLSEVTAATALSGADDLSTLTAAADAAASGDASSLAVIDAITAPGYLTTGASFDIDQSYSGAGLLVKTGASDPITVSNDVTITSGGRLSLLSGGALTIEAPITANGATAVVLIYDDSDAANLSFGLTSSGFDGSIDYGSTDNGGALSINGTSYTLLYSMADIDGIDGTAASSNSVNTQAAGLSGDYALATSLYATSDGTAAGTPTAYSNALVGTNSSGDSTTQFSGNFTGLGNTISDLTIAKSGDYAGLFGAAPGTIRDVGVVGGSVSGHNNVGGLVGYANTASSTIIDAYTTGTVSGTQNYVGGLTGRTTGGTISYAYATGEIDGLTDIGGLVGYNNGGTLSYVFATGTVSNANHASSSVGGLVGDNGGTITNAYATGVVGYSGFIGSGNVGGLAGSNSGTITSAYATGVVNGNSRVGGLVGHDNGGSVTNGYWDTETSGQSSSAGGTGLTTAQLQNGSSASGLGSAFTITSTLYPYLTNFFPNGVEAISGTAYKDAGVTVAASGPSGAVTINLDSGGALQGQAATGANGYYYVALQAGTVANGDDLLVSTPTSGSIALNGATLAASTYAGADTIQSGVDLYGGFLSEATSATTLSGAPSLSSFQSAANAVAGTDTTATTTIAAITNPGYLASGSFTADQDYTGSGLLVTTPTGEAITVSNPITINDGGALGLLSGGVLDVEAAIKAEGAASVALAYDDSDPTNLSFGLTAAGFTGSLSFTDSSGSSVTSDQGGSLVINGSDYTLLYNMTDVAGIGVTDDYALATSIDASSAGTYAQSVVDTLHGTLEGLGHSLSNLSVSNISDPAVGLFSNIYYTGTVRDLGIRNASITAGDNAEAGILAGGSGGTLTNIFTSGQVQTGDATGSTGSFAGGIVGFMDGGDLSYAYSSADVTAGDTSGTSYGATAGGLVGEADYATISYSAASGTITVGDQLSGVSSWGGGLAGYIYFTDVTNSYATGAVSGGTYANVGGLVGIGYLYSITESYATGAVTAASGTLQGGLLGASYSGYVTNGYWDTETSGQSTSHGGTGLTTAELQDGTSASALGSAFTITSGLYPYLTWQYPNGAQAVSGTAYSDSGVTPLATGSTVYSVSALADGSDLGSAATGANGYYYLLLPSGTVTSSTTAVLASSDGSNPGGRLDTGSEALDTDGNVSGFDIWGDTLIAPTSETTYSGASATTLQVQDAALIATAVGGYTDPTTGLSNYGYIASGDFTVDQSLTLSNGLYIKSLGDIAVPYALTLPGANGLTLDAAGTLTITAPVTVSGAGAVSLAYDDSDPANLSFGLSGLSFAGSIDYATTSGTLSVNGDSYTLLHDMSELAAINSNTGLQGNYALASSFDASSTSGWVPLGSDGSGNLLNSDNGFTGNLEGLGHAISNLTVDSGTNGGGLFAVIGDDGVSAYGTVRDLAVTDATISNAEYAGVLTADNYGDIVYVAVSGTITGDSSADTLGGLATTNLDYGLIENSVADVAINAGTGSDVYVGGLVGYNDNEIYGSYATGNVTALGDGATAGGLVGESDYSIEDSYATGSVTTGDGGPRAGGLVGYNNDGSITGSYATGNVTGGDSGTYDTEIGGLVGFNSGLIQQSYATGSVTAGDGGAGAGGLVGVNIDGFITESYASGSVLAGDGGADVGGLVGYNGSSGTVSGVIGIYESYAIGSVTGGNDGAWVGGLVGENEANIQNSYAMGAVHAGTSTGSETATVGGLVGYNDADGSISDSYATGAVTGSQADGTSIGSTTTGVANNNQYVGGLVGYDGVSGITIGSITDSYWDTETTGQSDGLGGADALGPTSITGGLTTAELQGTLSNTVLSSVVWGTGTDLYPYFLWQYPTTPQAVSGTAYGADGATPQASGVSGAVTVSVDANGSLIGQATTGANGYYYVLMPGGTIANGTDLVASIPADIYTGSQNTATLATSDYTASAPNQTGVDLYDGFLSEVTSVTTLSAADDLSTIAAAADAAASGDASAKTVIDAITAPGYLTTGSSFTVDTSYSGAGFLAATYAGDPITVASDVIITDGGRLSLLSGGALTIDAAINAQGAVGVSLAYDDSDATNLSFGLTASGFGGSLSFTDAATGDPIATGQGGTLSINGTSYTLLYSMADVDGIDSIAASSNSINNQAAGLSGNYALATSLDASGTTYTNALIGPSSSNGLQGVFTGLGHTISNLTINKGGDYAGLFGYSTGSIRDTGIVGGSMHGREFVGALIGNAGNGNITYVYATAAVDGTGRIGGLVGDNRATIVRAFATGSVTGKNAALSTYSYTEAGGLVGFNGGVISESYATGTVSGANFVGGLAGTSGGTISNSYATGTVYSSVDIYGSGASGGLVGFNNTNLPGGPARIEYSYATGTAIGGDKHGGAVGWNFHGSIVESYWDSETTGQATSGGSSSSDGLTTEQLQGSLPTGLDSLIWGTGDGLYPYLLWAYPNGAQAVSGTAYSDSGVTPLATGSTVYSVSALADGSDLGSVATGANGYYYILLPSGTMTSTTAVLASSDGGNPGSRLDTGSEALDTDGNVSGFDIWGGTLIAPTSETTYSGASATTLQVQDASLIATAVGGYTDPTTGLSNYGYIASGDFTVDQSLTLSNGLYIKSLGDIAVPYALTLPGANGLTLDAAGTLTIDAPITVSGAGAVSLTYDDSDGSNLSFGLTSSGFAGSVDFTGGSGSGASLTINGAAYTLLYSLSDLAGINTDSGLQDNYALATSLDASSWGDWTPLGTDGAGNRYNSNMGFSGSFTGLGHAVSDLTVDTGSKNYAGLFGYASGALRDIGIVGSSVTGNIYVGSLVGFAGSSVSDAYATATVNGLGYVGGLIGRANGAVTNTYATGAVDGTEYTGGLAGAAYNTVTNSYATGTVTATSEDTGGLLGFANSAAAVSNSYATGAVNGKDFTGGLIGEAYAAVTNAYATGAVNGRDYVGGLIGDAYAAVTNAYATGAVSARNHVGGLIGSRFHATVTNGYWDTETSGQSTSAGGIGLTTAVFQADSLSTLGFDSSVWSTGDGLYPYLTMFFPNGAQAITGIAYSDAGVTPLASGSAGAVTVSALADGAALGSATTGANGYYYILVQDGTLSGSQQLLTYLDGASTTANTYVADASGNTSADLYGSWVRMISDASATSTMFTGLSTALGGNSGSNFLYASGSGLVSGASLGIVSGNTAGFVIDTALDVGTETISLDAAGPVTQSAALTAANLLLLGSGADYTLTNGANAVDTLAADTGAINFANDADLTIGTVLTTAGITSTGAVTFTANGDITVDESIETSGGGDIVLAADQNFVNNVGASALTTAGRWLIYSAAPGSNTFGGLDSGNTAIWNATYATLPPASVTQSGNRYLFATQPTLTITTTDVGKTYGDDATSAVAAAYTISGYESGFAGVYLGDSASSVYSGTPSVTSAGSATTAGVSGSPYTITATAGSMSLLNGYAVSFVDSGALTVDPASLSITADDVTASSLANVQLTSSYSGLVNGETSAVVSGLQYGLFPVSGNSLQYDVVPFGASAANYTISYYEGLLTIAQPSAPIINNQGNSSTDIGTQSSSDFTLSGNFGFFSFGNVATASIGGSGGITLLFQVGLPGAVSPFDAIALGDYSNTTDSNDRLLCPSGGINNNNTSCAGGGGL